jgi:hypothetical protein
MVTNIEWRLTDATTHKHLVAWTILLIVIFLMELHRGYDFELSLEEALLYATLGYALLVLVWRGLRVTLRTR